MAKYAIGGIEFKNQNAIKKFCQEILAKHEFGEPVYADEYTKFLRALLNRHEFAEIKIGCGVEYFYVDESSFGPKCFWLKRHDGSRTDFSYLQCIRPLPPGSRQRSAFRHAVREQINEFFMGINWRALPLCPIAGCMVSPQNCEIDHVTPFKQLVQYFLTQEGLELEKLEVLHQADGQCTFEFADVAMTRRWQDYHRKHAVLQALSETGHRQKTFSR